MTQETTKTMPKAPVRYVYSVGQMHRLLREHKGDALIVEFAEQKRIPYMRNANGTLVPTYNTKIGQA